MHDPFSGHKLDASLTQLADDLASIGHCLSVKSALSRCIYRSALLDRSLGPIGVAQNQDKKQVIFRVFDQDSLKQLHDFYNSAHDFFGIQVRPAANSFENSFVNNTTEVQARQQSATTAWLSMGSAWRSVNLPLSTQISAYKLFVRSSLLSGLEATTLTQRWVVRLESQQPRYLRAIVGPKTFEHTDDGVRAVSAAIVRGSVDVSTVFSLPRKRRLDWMKEQVELQEIMKPCSLCCSANLYLENH